VSSLLLSLDCIACISRYKKFIILILRQLIFNKKLDSLITRWEGVYGHEVIYDSINSQNQHRSRGKDPEYTNIPGYF
jgi:hypothetical protein